jgi:F-type H+-transporting ATPase subunit a
LENARKRRFGFHRWFVLLFIILGIVSSTFFPPVQPHILVAAEKLTEHPLFTLPVIGDFYLTNTLTTMIVVDVVIILLALAVRNSLRRSLERGSLVPSGIAGAFEAIVEVIYNMTESTAGRWAKTIFPWFASILIIVLVSNWMGLIPGMEAVGFLHHVDHDGHAVIPGTGRLIAEKGEYAVVPWFRGMSTDLNFTAALALISVIAVQVVGVKAQGWRYIFRFVNVLNLFKKPFFGAMDLIVSLLELISEFSKILSFAFRLFGNMFAGMVLLFLVSSMAPVFAPSLVMTFEFFIGAIQAFVFGMLTLVFMSQATQGHGDAEHHE